MPTNKLTDSKCKGAKPQDKAYKLFDGEGLHLSVSPTGAKTWRLAYRLNGTPKTKSYGAYPGVSLADARQKRDEDKALLRDGIDPMAERQTERRRKTLTLRQACELYWDGRKDLSAEYLLNITRALDRHIYPHIGTDDLGDIDRTKLLAVLMKMNAAGKFNYVRKVRIWLSAMFDWAVENEYCAINPAALIDPKKAFGHKKTEHFASLELRDIPAFMKRMRMEGDLISVLACRLMAYTWLRTKEIRFIEPKEIHGDQWTIPAGKMKRSKDHVVPLSRQAKAIIDQLIARQRGNRYLLEAEHTTERPMSENTVLELIDRMGYKGAMTGHGWRTVGSTWANEHGYKADAIERQLSHVPGDKVRSAYNRAEYIDERRRMLQDWADWLDACEVDAGGAQG